MPDPITKHGALIDGGSFANNPALHAYVEASQLFGHDGEILLVSLGTGGRLDLIDYHLARRWGLLAWLNPRFRLPLVQVLLKGQSNDVHRTLQCLIPDPQQYWRFGGPVNRPLPMLDDATTQALHTLREAANAYVAREEQRLTSLARLLVRSAG